jgi:hypothetical protein
MPLLTLTEQQEIRPIDKNNTGKFAQLLQEVEANDVEKYLGFEMTQDLKRRPEYYKTFLNGGEYQLDGVAYSFQGFKAVIAYLLYARYVRSSYIQDTFSGMMQHTMADAQRLSAGELANQENRYQEIAGTLWQGCQHYMRSVGLEIKAAGSVSYPQPKQKKLRYL